MSIVCPYMICWSFCEYTLSTRFMFTFFVIVLHVVSMYNMYNRIWYVGAFVNMLCRHVSCLLSFLLSCTWLACKTCIPFVLMCCQDLNVKFLGNRKHNLLLYIKFLLICPARSIYHRLMYACR